MEKKIQDVITALKMFTFDNKSSYSLLYDLRYSTRKVTFRNLFRFRWND